MNRSPSAAGVGLFAASAAEAEPGGPALGAGAALAASAPPLAPHRQAQFFDLDARSILTRCASRRFPFAWTLNPYRGCEFGCHYCYARYAHEFLELRAPAEFERKIFVKRRAAELLAHDLRQVRPGQAIAIGTATDPYQPAEKEHRVTRALLEVFAEQRGLRLSLITKSDLIACDAALLARVARQNHLIIRLTVTTVDSELARALEPRAPRPDLRLRALRRLREAGLTVGVNCAPVLPGITDGPATLERLVAAAAAAGAQFVSGQALFLQPAAQAAFLPFLEARFPRLATAYRRQFSASPYLPASYRNRLARQIATLAATHGLALQAPTPPLESAQLDLFAAAALNGR